MTDRAVVDALIVGAGPAGSAAAVELARGGARVLVVDRASFPRTKTCGDAVPNQALTLARELGAGEALARAPQARVAGAVAVFPDGSRVPRSYGATPGAIVTRLAFDDTLRRAAEAAGAEVREGVPVRSLVVERGKVVGASAPGLEIRAPLTIVADGSGSLAWSALGTAAPRGRAQALAITAYYEGVLPGPDPDCSEHYFEPDLESGYGWIFPPVDGTANVGVYQRADRYHAAGKSLPELLDRFIARHRARFVGARRVGRTRTWALPLATERLPLAGAGVLVAGDASCLIDPLTGEGIWHALASGRMAGAHGLRALSGAGLDAGAARRYRWACARRVAWPSALRVGIQDAVDVLVTRDLYRNALVKRALGWGYGGNALEVSKRVGA